LQAFELWQVLYGSCNGEAVQKVNLYLVMN